MLDIRHAAGLRNLRQRLQEADVHAEFVLLKHGHEALGTVWDTQSLVGSASLLQFHLVTWTAPHQPCVQVRNEDISTVLLVSCAHLLEASHSHTTDQLDRLALTEALDHFADSILARRTKYLQQQLASTVRNKANSVLYLLVAIAFRGGSLTSRLLRVLDCDLPVLVKLSHPPK